MKWHSRLCLCLGLCLALSLETWAAAPGGGTLRLAGYRWDTKVMLEAVLAPEQLPADNASPWCLPEEYARFAGVYLGENLKGAPPEALWASDTAIGQVRSYVSQGGTIILSGGVVNGLAGEGRRLDKIQEILGFAGTSRLDRARCEGVRLAAGGKIQPWHEAAADVATRLGTAEILGVFLVAGQELPAITVNRLGSGKVFWISPLYARLQSFYQKNNKSLGAADDEGRFVVSAEGEALEELRKLYLQCFKATGVAAAAPPAATGEAWEMKPLGPRGEITYAEGQFKKRPEFRVPRQLPPGLPLYGHGPQAVIVVPAGAASPLPELAAELAYHLRQMTGAEFTVAAQAPPGVPALVFGDAQTAAGFGVDYARLPAQTAVLRRQGDRLLIGGRDGGESLALTYLLESLGCRYLWPGPSGKVIPRRSTLILPELDWQNTPELVSRGIRNPSALNERWAGALKRCGIDPQEFDQAYRAATVDHPGNRDFYRWHGVNLTERGSGFGHAFGHYFERYGQSHPEFFALQPDGTRSQEASPLRARLCMSQSGLIQAVAAEKIAQLRENPGLDCVSLCPNDGSYNNFCMCVECRRLDPVNAAPISMLVFRGRKRENVDYVALSDRVLAFSNRVAEQVTAAVPGKNFGIYVYSYYGKPPVLVKPHPALRLAATNASYTQDTARAAAMRDLAAWSSFGNPMIWRPNALWGVNTLLMPQNYARKLFADLETLKANGFIGTDFDCNELLWSGKGLMYYTLAKALWNPDRLDYDAYFQDYCQSGFGPAAHAIIRYFTLLEKTSDRVAAEAASLGDIFDEALIGELQGQLTAAVAAAAGDAAILERIAFLQTALDAGKLNRALHVAKQNQAAEYRPLQEQFMQFLRDNARKNPVAMNPMYTGFYNAFVR